MSAGRTPLSQRGSKLSSTKPKNYNQKIISKSSIPNQIHNTSHPKAEDLVDEKDFQHEPTTQQSDQMKEAAHKVVELQRTVMKLRSQLKAKQDL